MFNTVFAKYIYVSSYTKYIVCQVRQNNSIIRIDIYAHIPYLHYQCPTINVCSWLLSIYQALCLCVAGPISSPTTLTARPDSGTNQPLIISLSIVGVLVVVICISAFLCCEYTILLFYIHSSPLLATHQLLPSFIRLPLSTQICFYPSEQIKPIFLW